MNYHIFAFVLSASRFPILMAWTLTQDWKLAKRGMRNTQLEQFFCFTNVLRVSKNFSHVAWSIYYNAYFSLDVLVITVDGSAAKKKSRELLTPHHFRLIQKKKLPGWRRLFCLFIVPLLLSKEVDSKENQHAIQLCSFAQQKLNKARTIQVENILKLKTLDEFIWKQRWV